MNGKALMGAGVGAVVGAIIWAAIAASTGYEIGYVAWGVGALVGGGARWGGASDSISGILAACIALGSIFVGKLVAVNLTLDAEINRMAEQFLTQEDYDLYTEEAAAFARIAGEEEAYPEFMIEYGYSEGEDADEVTEEELEWFVEYSTADLEFFQKEKPDYETWRTETAETIKTRIKHEMPPAEMVKQNLGAIDLLFAFLGVATAYKLASGGGD